MKFGELGTWAQEPKVFCSLEQTLIMSVFLRKAVLPILASSITAGWFPGHSAVASKKKKKPKKQGCGAEFRTGLSKQIICCAFSCAASRGRHWPVKRTELVSTSRIF